VWVRRTDSLCYAQTIGGIAAIPVKWSAAIERRAIVSSV
jgi:hypothetical protein